MESANNNYIDVAVFSHTNLERGRPVVQEVTSFSTYLKGNTFVETFLTFAKSDGIGPCFVKITEPKSISRKPRYLSFGHGHQFTALSKFRIKILPNYGQSD